MTFEVTEEQFEHLVSKLKDNGGTLEPSHPSNHFTVNMHGVVAQVDYDTESGALDVEVAHKPFFVSEEHIENGIQSYIDSMPTGSDETANDSKDENSN